MIDLVTLHNDPETDKYVLMIFHDIHFNGYIVDDVNKELSVFYRHSQDEGDYSKDEVDYETFIWMDDGKTFVEPADRYEGICINHRWYPRGELSLDEYMAQIRIPLENELVEQNLKQITEEPAEPEETESIES